MRSQCDSKIVPSAFTMSSFNFCLCPFSSCCCHAYKWHVLLLLDNTRLAKLLFPNCTAKSNIIWWMITLTCHTDVIYWTDLSKQLLHNYIHINMNADQLPLTRCFRKVTKIRWFLTLEDGRLIGCTYIFTATCSEIALKSTVLKMISVTRIMPRMYPRVRLRINKCILCSEAWSFCGHRNVLVKLWLTCL